MYFLIYGTILVIGLSWWFITHAIRRRSDLKQLKEPEWTSFVEDFRSIAHEMQNNNQLDEYLESVNDKVKMFETDYAFLVAFNTTVRDIRDSIGSGESFIEN